MAFKITLGTLGVTLVLDDSEFKRGMRSVRGAIDSAGLSIGKVAAGVGAATAAGLTLAVSEWAKLEHAVMNAAAVTEEGAAVFDDFLAASYAASAGTQFSGVEAAQGLQFLSMAGFQAAESIQALPGVLDLATAANEKLGVASDITSDIMTSMGMKVEELGRVNDVLVKTFTSSNTTLAMLGDTFKYMGPVASAFGQDIETVATLAAKLGNAGIKGAQAGTVMRQMFVRLVKPMKTTKAAMAELGVSLSDSDGNFRDFIEVLGDLEEAQGRMTDAKFAENLARVFGSEALPGVQALLKATTKDLRALRDELDGAGGTAESVAETMRSTLSNQMKILTGNVQNLAARFGQTLAPAIRVINSWLTAQVLAISTNDEAFNDFRNTIVRVLRSTANFIRGSVVVIKMLAGIAGATSKAVRGLQMLYKTYELAKAVKDRMDATHIGVIHGKNEEIKQLKLDIEELADASDGSFEWWVESGDMLAEKAEAFADAVDQSAAAVWRTSRSGVEAQKKMEDLAAALDAAVKSEDDLDDKTRNTNKALDDQSIAAEKAAKKLDALAAARRKLAKAQEKADKEAEKKRKSDKKAVEKVSDKLLEVFVDKGKKDKKKKEEREAIAREKKERFDAHQAILSDFNQSVFEGLADTISTITDVLTGGERSVLGPAMDGLSSAITNASAGAAGAGMALASFSRSMLQYILTHEDVAATIGVLRNKLQADSLDIVGRYADMLAAPIGAIEAIGESMGGFDGALDLIGQAFDLGARATYENFVRVAKAVLRMQLAAEKFQIVVLKVASGMVGFSLKVADIFNDSIGKVFKKFAIDTSDLEAAKSNIDASLAGSQESAEGYAAALDSLKDMTFEEAKAKGKAAVEAEKMAENMKELNSELRNAPSGFKIARARFAAMDAQTSRDRSTALPGTGTRTAQQPLQSINNYYFNGLTYKEALSEIDARLERRKFVRIGSSTATPAQRAASSVRAGLRQG